MYSQAPVDWMPNSDPSTRVIEPLLPTVAMNANASMTPPNWASTEHAAATTLRVNVLPPAVDST